MQSREDTLDLAAGLWRIRARAHTRAGDPHISQTCPEVSFRRADGSFLAQLHRGARDRENALVS